jgi:hypothetical protein
MNLMMILKIMTMKTLMLMNFLTSLTTKTKENNKILLQPNNNLNQKYQLTTRSNRFLRRLTMMMMDGVMTGVSLLKIK